MQRLLISVQNRLLDALPADDFGLIAPHLAQIDLERGRLLYDPGDRIDTVYFPHDGVISLMTLMENGAAIESATIGCEGFPDWFGYAAGDTGRLPLIAIRSPVAPSVPPRRWTRNAHVRKCCRRRTERVSAT